MGEEIAHAQTYKDEEMGGLSWSGKVGEEMHLDLYKTSGDNYVCHRRHISGWLGVKDRSYGKLCHSIQEVFDFFGDGWIARELYAKAHLEYKEAK
jgi:hypothetical protein